MNARVLVVEDEPDIVMMLRLSLQTAGYHVESAGTGEEALAKLRAQRMDAVLLDIRLPGIDGWEVLRIMREDVSLRNVPVIVVSAHTSPLNAERAGELGARGYIKKPFAVPDLLDTVARALA